MSQSTDPVRSLQTACSTGDLNAARECYESLFSSCEESDDTIRIEMKPGAANIIKRSLCLAAAYGHVPIVEYLLDQGAPITRDLVQTVCRAERVEVFEVMLRYGWDINEWKEGAPPLSDATSSAPCTRWLLEHGADPNPSQNGDSKHPLTYAAAFESVEVVELLVKHGAQVKDTMAMHAAAASSSKEDEMDDHKLKPDPSRLEVLRILLDNGGNVNEMEEDPKWRKHRRLRTCYTGTPLHHTVQHGSLEAIRFLLSRGADPLHPSWSGHTVIQAAEMARREEVVEILKQHVKCAAQ